MRRWIGLLGIVMCVSWSTGVLARPKTDTVTVKNGDTVHCEIKSLSRGKITAKTADIGTLDIKWSEVIAIHSKFYFRVETSDGGRYYGSISQEKGSDMLVISGMVTLSVEAHDVVEIAPIEQGFWDRNDGSLNFGFNFTKGTQVRQMTFDWSNLYRTERNIVNLTANAIFTQTGKDSATVKQADITITYYRLLDAKKWTGSLGISVQRNDALGLDRRLLLGLGTGVNAIRSNRNNLLLSVGLAINSELGADTTQSTQSLEAMIGGSYSFYRYNTPKTDISTYLNVFPSITERGRIRANFDIRYSHELVTDFTGGVRFFVTYDNQPATEGANTTDWGIVLSIGWSY